MRQKGANGDSGVFPIIPAAGDYFPDIKRYYAVKDDAERPLETAIGRLTSAALCGRLSEKWSIA
jgi:hypothetical protein